MRRKQLYAIMLAGALAVGSAPASVFAEEGVVVAAETEGAPIEETGESAPAEESTPAPEAPAESTPVAEAPAEESTPAPEAPAESTPAAETSSESTPTPTVEAVPEAATVEAKILLPGESETDTGISVTVAGAEGEAPAVHYFESIQAAVDAVADSASTTVPVIKLTKDIAVNAAVELKDGKRVCITAVSAVKLTRAEGFTGNLFAVSGMDAATGTGSELQLKVEGEGASLTLDGAGADGSSLISVGESGAFGMFDGVTLTNNRTTDNGGAITNDGGRIILAGGTITANTGAKGGIYSNTAVCVQGNIVISENKSVNTEGQETVSNLYVEAAEGTAAVKVTDTLGDSASVGYTDAAPADNKVVIEAGTKGDGTALSAEEFKNAVGKMAYDDSAKFTINLAENALQATLKAVVDATPTPTAVPDTSVTPEPTQTATPTPTAVATPTPVPIKLSYVSGSKKWINHTTVEVKMTSTGDCKWGYFFVDAGTSDSNIKKKYKSSYAVNAAYANTQFTVTAENVPETDSWLVVCAKPNSGASVKLSVLKLDSSDFKKKRPAVTPTGTVRAARTYKVSESTVTGLENAMKFFPGKFYEFSVVGAGQNDTGSVVGDERWIPLYWSTSKNPTSENQRNTSWKIGSAKGIKAASTYNMYIFCKKQTYNGETWIDTDVVEYLTTQFMADSITDEEWNAYIAELSGTPIPEAGYDGYDTGSGEGDTEAELTEAASEKDTGATSKSAVSTADESPIGTMSALAMLSLLAGGYILVRKRKKEEI